MKGISNSIDSTDSRDKKNILLSFNNKNKINFVD